MWRAGTAYTFTVTARNAAGQVSYSGDVGTTAVSGRVTCDDNGGTYCDDGVGIYADSRQQSNEAKGDATDGTRFQAWCKKDGTRGNQGGPSLFATTYNNNKRSTWWVQITYEGTSYIPFIWINLDNGDDVDSAAELPVTTTHEERPVSTPSRRHPALARAGLRRARRPAGRHDLHGRAGQAARSCGWR